MAHMLRRTQLSTLSVRACGGHKNVFSMLKNVVIKQTTVWNRVKYIGPIFLYRFPDIFYRCIARYRSQLF